jgi:transcriptional antiterminator RfaH
MEDDTRGPSGEIPMDCGRYSARWRVIVAEPRQEELAALSLAGLGYLPDDVFLPMVRVPLRQHHVTRPLFPGYLFARIDTTTAHWGEVYRARGVHNILAGPGSTIPCHIPSAVIQAIRKHCDEANTVVEELRLDPITTGVQVTVTAGPFLDQRGICLWSSHHRVRLMLDVLGTVVNVPRRSVRAVS